MNTLKFVSTVVITAAVATAVGCSTDRFKSSETTRTTATAQARPSMSDETYASSTTIVEQPAVEQSVSVAEPVAPAPAPVYTASNDVTSMTEEREPRPARN